MREEKLYTDLLSIAVEKDRISDKFTRDKWRSMSYTTKFGKGQMLLVPQHGNGEDVTLDINLDGYYKIYIGQIILRAFTYTYIKLTDDEFFTGYKGSSKNIPCSWEREESLMETFWKCADMTNQKVIIGRPNSFATHLSNIAWLKFVPMTDEEIEKFKNAKYEKIVQSHSDEDIYARDGFETAHDFCYSLSRLNGKNIDFHSQEISFDFDNYKQTDYVPLREKEKLWSDMTYKAQKIFDYKEYVKYAHDHGFRLFAANRMSVAGFRVPYTLENWSLNFVDEHPEFHCVNRDGSTIKVCSYAFDEVQDYVINNMVEKMKCGFDGLTMIMHRGTHIGFEQPVIDRIKELYPDVDPFTLPFTDERLHGVWCEFMTKFVKKLRKAFDEISPDKHLEINPIMAYGIESAKQIGLDCVEWAKQGLVDCITQSDMETYEDLTDCMSDENPELIDVEKYKKQLEDRCVICRRCGTNIDKACGYIKEYMELEEKYGVKVYCVLPWEGSVEPDKYEEVLDKLRSFGAKRFFRWNANQIMPDTPEWNIVREISNRDKISYISKQFHRVTEIDGSDFGQFNPNWRG